MVSDGRMPFYRIVRSGDCRPAMIQETDDMRMTRKLIASGLALCMAASACIPSAAAQTEAEAADLKKTAHVCVHDPSIFEDADGSFYVLGSHTASASSEDLIEWKQLNFDYGSHLLSKCHRLDGQLHRD